MGSLKEPLFKQANIITHVYIDEYNFYMHTMWFILHINKSVIAY